jgi:hypothetical protein
MDRRQSGHGDFLGLNIGIKAATPALKLPAIGRLVSRVASLC